NIRHIVEVARRGYGTEGFVADKVRKSDDRIEGRSELMAHAGEKLRLALAGRLCPAAGQFQFFGAVRHDAGDNGHETRNRRNAQITPSVGNDESLQIVGFRPALQQEAVYVLAFEI